MTDGVKKKIVIKRKAGGVSPIKLNSPAAQSQEHDAEASTQEDAAKSEHQGSASEAVVFKFYCVYCGQKLSAKDTMSGKRITCPACQRKIVVPTPPDA